MAEEQPPTMGADVNVDMEKTDSAVNADPPAKPGMNPLYLIIGGILAVVALAGIIVVIVLIVGQNDDSSDSSTDPIECNLPTPSTIRRDPMDTMKRSSTSSMNTGEGTVWYTMKSWTPKTKPAPKPAGTKLTVGMHMWSNSMAMIDTTFISTTGTNIRRDNTIDERRAVQKGEQDCLNALNSEGKNPSGYKIKDVVKMGFNAGPFSLDKYMLGDSMTMATTTFTAAGKTESNTDTTINSDGFGNTGQVKADDDNAESSSSSSDLNMYMANNDLSMTNTIFTMNVGSSSGGRRGLSTLNINMYMCHNSMSMTDTVFKMNIGSSSSSSDTSPQTQIEAGTAKIIDLPRLLLLTVSSLDTSSRRSGQNVWDWITEKAGSKSEMTINMHMFNNTMSMDTTTFTFNVQSASSSSGSGATATTSTTGGTIENDGNDKYIFNSDMKMEDTEFTMDVGTSRRGRRAGAMSVGKMNIAMYMYSNHMDMQTTKFTATIG